MTASTAAVIRIADGVQDETQVTNVLICAFAALYETVGIPFTEGRRKQLSDTEARRGAVVFLASIDGAGDVGTATLVPSTTAGCQTWVPDAWELRFLGVAPEGQGKGVASALLQHAERYAADHGAQSMCLQARRGMQVQAKFYPKCGYTRDPRGDKDATIYMEGYHKALV